MPASSSDLRGDAARWSAQWTESQARCFLIAFQTFKDDWEKVAQEVPGKTPIACEQFHKAFKSFLSLPSQFLNVDVFWAVVKDKMKADDSGEERSEPQSEVTVTDTERDNQNGAGPRRSARVPKPQKIEDVGLEVGPVWGSRKPRRQSLRTSPADRKAQAELDEEEADAMGVEALMSLAAGHTAPESGFKDEVYHSDFEDSAPHNGFLRDTDQEYEESVSRPSRRRGSGRGRSRGGRRGTKTRIPPLPSSPVLPKKRRTTQTRQPLQAEDGDTDRGTTSRALSRGRRALEVESPQSSKKRPRRRPSAAVPLRDAWDDGVEDVDMDGEEDWGKSPVHSPQVVSRKKKRKSRPEKAPPMMATASAIFARRNSLAFGAPPAAFLLGVPPASAQWCGIETEGQAAMEAMEIRLRHCLDPRVRRWCQAEFFCSAIDRPFFMRNELADYLQHVLQAPPRDIKLSRAELCIIRASLGQPRRLSLNFLREERLKLEAWREHVRAAYKAVDSSSQLPPDIPKQLQVGARVTARHPTTRQLHDGDILTTSTNSYRIQFLRQELGVEPVRDTDVMPVNPTEYLPYALHRMHPNVVLNGRQAGRPKDPLVLWLDHPQPPINLLAPPAAAMNPPRARTLFSAPRPPAGLPPSDTIKTIEEYKSAVETRDSLLRRLKAMHDEVEAGLHKECNGQGSLAFQNTYQMTVTHLQNVTRLIEAWTLPRPNALPLAPASLPQRLPPPISSQPLAQYQVTPAQSAPMPSVQPVRPPIPWANTAAGCWDTIWGETQATLAQVKRKNDLDAAKSKADEISAAASTKPASEPAVNQPSSAEDGSDLPTSPTSLEPKVVAAGSLPRTMLDTRIAGCISILHTLHQCSEKAQTPGNISRNTEKALKLLRPIAKENLEAYNMIENRTHRLAAHLSKAKPSEIAAILPIEVPRVS